MCNISQFMPIFGVFRGGFFKSVLFTVLAFSGDLISIFTTNFYICRLSVLWGQIVNPTDHLELFIHPPYSMQKKS